ncbi:hypothetical protein BKA65DRAFT_20764 [Rhexocercosporidium sp. MPI-PUGE-AT-0058]|nr:hypothetical protein BKA65DRAFT_20764 [Rhexocercosporidium sp. MPI-PUGE-AT-0058]
MSGSGVFGAISAVLGYVGAEAATNLTIERLLWPQRSYSNFTWKSVPLHALLMPMSGPLHIVSLKSLDNLFDHGMLKGGRLGHMLGTSFYPTLNWTFTMWNADDEEVRKDDVRNAVWVRALDHMPIPVQLPNSPRPLDKDIEKRTTSSKQHSVPLRSVHSVSRIILAKATDTDKQSDLPFVSEENNTPTIRTFIGICTAETTSILVAVILLTLHKSLWAIWWFVPLFLRLLSALFAVDREGVKIDQELGDSVCNYEIHCPHSNGNFMLITGPQSVVDQFFVHYGHPVRNRFREILQIVIIVLFGAIFPVGLFFSVIFMPLTIQYVWLCCQLYVVLTMLVTRYFYRVNGTATEARIAKQLSRQLSKDNRSGAEDMEGTSILFGQERNCATTVKASLVVTYHDRWRDGKNHLNAIIHGGVIRQEAHEINKVEV